MTEERKRLRSFYLSLGSNIRPAENLRKAVRMLGAFGEITALASVYKSPSFGDPMQPDYLNTAVRVESALSPAAFRVQAIASIEDRLGRVRTENRYAARTIDIDIVLVDREILTIDHRSIPSPEILGRAFVAVPLAEIDPEYVHPEDGRTLAEIASGLSSGALQRTELKIEI